MTIQADTITTTTNGQPPCYTTRTTCRVCGSKELVPLFSLGKQYVSNFLAPDEQPQHLVPIDIELCRVCNLVQAKHTAPQELLYRRFYWYKSGVTSTMRAALADIVRDVQEIAPLRAGDAVLDIGSNDGTLLRCYPDHVTTIGCEPAENLHEEGSRGVDYLIRDFWSYDAYQFQCKVKPKIITAIGMFYDLEEPGTFIGDIAKVLAPGGLFVAQLMCLKNMLEMRDVGNFAHEHLEYYSLRSLKHLFYSHGLEIFDVTNNNVNGESYRIYARHLGSKSPIARPGAAERLAHARALEDRYDEPAFYREWFAEIDQNRQAIRQFVKDAVKDGKRVWLYGASTKGNVILQWAGLDHTLIEGAAERSPEKWGKRTVGTDIPIYSEADARAANPDYFLCLPYAFIDEFVVREAEWYAGGGRFIVPLPSLHVV